MIKPMVASIDTFVVINKTNLNDQDRLSLTLLYQPIVGSLAISLYLTLWSYLDKDKVSSDSNTHQELVANMQMKLEDIVEAREKLEALGLVKTYYQKGEVNRYIYELYSPLSSYEFLNNPILNTALYNNVSKKEYKRIVSQFTIPKLDLSKYNDITCSFSDVYSFMASNKLDMPNVKKASHLDLAFEPTIAFHDVLAFIPEELLNYKSISKDTINVIYQLAFIYDIDSATMADMIKNAIENRKINLELLKDNLRNYYKFENKGKNALAVYRNQPLFLRQKRVENNRQSQLINQFETTNPHEFLMLKQDSKPTTKDMQLLEYLLIDQNLKPGVVNVLIDYVLKINNNKLVRPFVEQIATQWKRSHIETVSDAIAFAQAEFDSKNNKRKSKTVLKPSWFDQDIEEELLSAEESQELERKLKGVSND